MIKETGGRVENVLSEADDVSISYCYDSTTKDSIDNYAAIEHDPVHQFFMKGPTSNVVLFELTLYYDGLREGRLAR